MRNKPSFFDAIEQAQKNNPEGFKELKHSPNLAVLLNSKLSDAIPSQRSSVFKKVVDSYTQFKKARQEFREELKNILNHLEVPLSDKEFKNTNTLSLLSLLVEKNMDITMREFEIVQRETDKMIERNADLKDFINSLDKM